MSTTTPDSTNFEIERAEQIGRHLILEVRYPNCSSCPFEGRKVMVYLDTTTSEALLWKKIDPHFSDPKKTRTKKEAPSPSARFPASSQGWTDAIAYARSKAPFPT